MDYSEYIRINESASTAVLMVHGIISSPRHFDWMISVIPEEWSVCNILLDGHGGRVKDFSKTSMKQWKEQVGSWLERLSEQHSSIIVVGYSLGTLLTIELAEKYPKIKGMLLLNPPLKVALNPVMIKRSTCFSFGKVNRDNPAELAMYEDLSIALEPYLWKYLGWIPQFIQLLVLCRQCRDKVSQLKMPCYVLFGKKDELVSLKSKKYFDENSLVEYEIFENSGHCYYEPEFKKAATKSFENLVRKIKHGNLK